jgi:thioredoxin reductase
MSEYDVVIIGGGAAGLSAALVLTRAMRRVAVVDAGVPRNAAAAHMHGFPGSDGLPSELLAAGRKEESGYGGHLIDDTVRHRHARHSGGHARFEVSLTHGDPLRSRRVLLATSLRDDVPTSRESASGEAATCCTALTATGTRSATNRSASSAVPRRP